MRVEPSTRTDRVFLLGIMSATYLNWPTLWIRDTHPQNIINPSTCEALEILGLKILWAANTNLEGITYLKRPFRPRQIQTLCWPDGSIIFCHQKEAEI